MENKDSDELNAVTSQVLDYYQRYSQNQNFSSYLRGTIPSTTDKGNEAINVIEITEIPNDEEVPSVSPRNENDENDINLGNIIEDQRRFPSPTSSIASNRKLEWDNLGDIGYGNCSKQKPLHKSLSLPVLSTLEKIQLGQKKLHFSLEGNVADQKKPPCINVKYSSTESGSSGSYRRTTEIPSDSTSSFQATSTVIDTTSTISSISKLISLPTETEITDAESTVIDKNIGGSYLKFIRQPMAESTPNNIIGKNILNNAGKVKESVGGRSDSNQNQSILPDKDETCDTKSESWSSGNDNIGELKCIATCLRSNVKHLSVTTPLGVECRDDKKIAHKDIQTSIRILKTNSIGIQTDECVESDDHIVESKIYPVYDDRGIAKCIKNDLPSESNVRSLGTNTDSDVRASQCNSFEYLYGEHVSDGSKMQLSNTTSASSQASGDKSVPAGSRSKRDLEAEKMLTSSITELSSKTSPLAELISTKLSNHVINDVDKSIIILQKLLKSKKYDKVTKQYYVKKIVQKILNFNYSSESPITSEAHSGTTSDNPNGHNGEITPKTIKLINVSPVTREFQEAVPQMPIKLELNKRGNPIKRKKLDIQTFSTEIFPEHSTVNDEKIKHPLKLKDARFTIATNYNNCKTSDEVSLIGDVNPENSPPRSRPQSALATSDSSNKSGNFGNWRQNVTKSEKFYSSNVSSNDSELLNFAKKERENQISWINNEINHLNKLKNLLQKKSLKTKTVVESLSNLQNEGIPENNKTTSVYVITTEKGSLSSNSTGTSSARPSSKRFEKRCNCLHSEHGSIPCDSSDCPLLKYASEKSLKLDAFHQMLQKDVKTLPHLENFSRFPSDRDIENAKLIASEIYPGQSGNSCVRRYVFEMPINTDEGLSRVNEKQNIPASSELLSKIPNCNIKMDAQNAKFIASEISEGTSPNTCVRRYVFEIPIRKDASSGKQSGTSGSEVKTLPSSNTPKTSHFSKKSCKCQTTTILKPYERGETKEALSQEELNSITSTKFESSDLVCICQVGNDKHIEVCPNCKLKKTPVKVVQTNVRSDPKKSYRLCVKRTDDTDTVSYVELPECKTRKKCSCQKCPSKQCSERQVDSHNASDEKPVCKCSKCIESREKREITKMGDFDEQQIDIQKRNQKKTKAQRTETGLEQGYVEDETYSSTSDNVPETTQRISSGRSKSHRKGTHFSTSDTIGKTDDSRYKSQELGGSVGDEGRPTHRKGSLGKGTSHKSPTKSSNDSGVAYADMTSGDAHSESKQRDGQDIHHEHKTQVRAHHGSTHTDGEQYDKTKDGQVSLSDSKHPPIDGPEADSILYESQKVFSNAYEFVSIPVKHVGNQKEIFHIVVPSVTTKETDKSSAIEEKEKLNKANQYELQPDQIDKMGNNVNELKKNEDLERKKSKRGDKYAESSSDYQSDSSGSGSSESTEDVPRICLCCNAAEARFRSKLHGLPNQIRNALCDPCYVQSQQTSWSGSRPNYTYPGHICNCYAMIKTETVRNIQRTVEELENLERERGYCTCSYGCRMQYRDGKGKHKKAIAYTLTFEDVEKTDSEEMHNRHKKAPLDEVRVKIPRFVKKSRKDRENRKKSKHEKHDKHRRKRRQSKHLTLQDHLWTNRPNFIANAEERRKELIELAYMREERCQKYKQLLAMSNGNMPHSNFNKPSKPRMFTSKEMKEMTAKNYKRLPEVQKKLEENRNRQIKKANKILSDIFNKKLRERVLKGKPALSMSTSVIKLP